MHCNKKYCIAQNRHREPFWRPAPGAMDLPRAVGSSVLRAEQILWANPAGAAIFDAASPGEASALHFKTKHPASAQVARLVVTLPGAVPARRWVVC